MEKHAWLRINSERLPYKRYDISVIIPSAAGRYTNRWTWFWPQYIKDTHPSIVENTYIPCDQAEYEFLKNLCPEANVFVTEPRWIACKTLAALNLITTRLTFRLANDIMVVRNGWEEPLLEQFNAVGNLQLIAKVTHGISFPEDQEALERDWEFIREKYKSQKKATACVYPHGSVLMAQTALWRAYYSQVTRYTLHEHDEIYLSQIAQSDGVQFTNMTGLDRFLCHVGVTNKDFNQEYMKHIIEEKNKWSILPPTPGFKVCE